MKHRGFCLVLVLAVMLCGRVALGQDSLGPQPKKALTSSDYKPQTLRQIAADEAKSASRQKDAEKVFVHGDLRFISQARRSLEPALLLRPFQDEARAA